MIPDVFFAEIIYKIAQSLIQKRRGISVFTSVKYQRKFFFFLKRFLECGIQFRMIEILTGEITCVTMADSCIR